MLVPSCYHLIISDKHWQLYILVTDIWLDGGSKVWIWLWSYSAWLVFPLHLLHTLRVVYLHVCNTHAPLILLNHTCSLWNTLLFVHAGKVTWSILAKGTEHGLFHANNTITCKAVHPGVPHYIKYSRYMCLMFLCLYMGVSFLFFSYFLLSSIRLVC